ncbi:MAG: DNA polymerase-2, partial [Lentisphaeria bacterium]
RALALKSFSHESVHAIYFARQRDLYQAREFLKQQGLTPLEADIQPADRFLMERFITGGVRLHGKALESGAYLEFRNPSIKPSDFVPALKVVSLDIETSMQGEVLFSIAILCYRYDGNVLHGTNQEAHAQVPRQRIVFMLGEQGDDGPISAEQQSVASVIKYCDTEAVLLRRFIRWFQQCDPDIVIGWNVINFDFRFLQRKADSLSTKLRLGRASTLLDWRQSKIDEQHFTLTVPGRSVLDGIDALKSATFSFESFSLDSVASNLLNRGKLIHDVDNRCEEIGELFSTNKVALAAYNMEDCQLVWEIFCHTQLLYFSLERARLTGLAMDRFGGSVAAFDNRYLPRLHRAGFVAPSLQDDPVGVGSPGGFVMESQPGLYRNVLVLDFKSLYPSIIRTFKIDPLARACGEKLCGDKLGSQTLTNDKLETQNVDLSVCVPGFNGAAFSRDTCILPGIIDELWLARDRAKLEKNNAMSQAVKILMNSFYGVLGTPGCRFFDSRLPSSITLRGHQILNKTKQLIEEKGFKVIYGDTDSVFVAIPSARHDDNASEPSDREPLELRDVGHRLAKDLNAWWKKHLKGSYNITSYLELEYEIGFSHFIMPTIRGSEVGSKKRYAGRVLGGKPGQDSALVFKGLETVRTDWTVVARNFQRELYRRIFYDEPYQEYIRAIVEEIRHGNRDPDLVYRKRIRRKLDDYRRNVPPHVHAARIADARRKKEGLSARYARGGWIRYVMTVNGPEPVEYQSSVLDYERYIERQIQPIVDGITHFLGISFDEIAGPQQGLF